MRRARLKATILTMTVALASAPGPVLACSSCFGAADGPMIDAARLGTWLLLGVVFCVQVAFAAFFLYLRRRAARLGQDAGAVRWSDAAPGPHGEWRSA